MKREKTLLMIMAAVTLLLTAGLTGVLSLYSYRWALAAAAVLAAELIIAALLYVRFRRITTEHIRELTATLKCDQQALSVFPMPALLANADGEVLYYNDRFNTEVLDGTDDSVGVNLQQVFAGFSAKDLHRNTVDVQRGPHRLTAYIRGADDAAGGNYVLYFCDNTALKNVAAEYTASRPVMLLICIDNLEETTQQLRDSDRARIAGQIETMLEDWITSAGGVLQKYGNDRFVAMTENRQLAEMTKSRFKILDEVRGAFSEVDSGITLSIGVGQGKTMQECQVMARQALDMALSRGGDQAALKTANGFDFYGGASRGVERRTKVRTRVLANALCDLIRSSDRVMVMGHRLSDLDCLGSGVALASAIRKLGVPAYAVVHRRNSMAKELINRCEQAGLSDLFVEPEDALEWVGEQTLLIITDTHTADRLDGPELYKAASRVVVIDHHRKMVNHIQNSVLTYHEPSSSSACELVAELLQYMGERLIGRTEAEALLSGIMLDTRSFVLRTGVRTFEAAAYLRQLGADTVAVKKMFVESMDLYRRKSELISKATVFHGMAISVSEEDHADQRAAAAQAADELLSVQGVIASFVICPMGREINVSARSYGDCNVQLIMEAMGGGGHLTMAGTQISNQSVYQVENRLKELILEFEKNK